MQHHQERPDLRADRALCIAGLIAVLGAGDWLLLQIIRDLDNTAPWRVLALVAVIGLALYLSWMLLLFTRVQYHINGNTLIIRRIVGCLEISMSDVLHLYRWRQRWLWSDGSRAELGVEDVTLIPNTVLRLRGTWVLVYRSPGGDRRAVGLLPSATLLAFLKALMWEHQRSAG